ncbi:hypothetical protein ACGFI9_03970 [Micromonospora sp. NPDC048930]|uniref:hypothetical protein n=1 Tax=Micromonospora sp. NPDC048930 TaxID=3364261 RepID=UPI00371E2D47
MPPNDESALATPPPRSRRLESPVLNLDAQAKAVAKAVNLAVALDKVGAAKPVNVVPTDGVFTLEQFQSPFKQQNDRGTCWAFAGAAALEAAYRRKFGTLIDVSEEYIFHMGKAFALNRDAQGNVVQPVENNSSLTGFQGSGDIVKKLSENAAPPESTAPCLPTQQALLDILPVLGFPNQQSLTSQEDFDAVEFCEQHIPLLARVNARYRASDWASLGRGPTIEALENTLLANHEVVCDVTHKTPPQGGHVLLLIGFDRNRRVFFAKNHWGENAFIEIKYENDPNWSIDTGWYIKDVVDPAFVQNEACWLGNWWLTIGGDTFRVLLRRSEDFVAPGTPTRLGSAYLGDGRHDVNGTFLEGGSHLRLFLAPGTAPTAPGTLSGTQIDVSLDFSDIYNVSGSSATAPVSMSRFTTRFAALFETDDGAFAWQARHGIDGDTYQRTFDELVAQGFRLTSVCGYSEGRDARFNAIWQQRSGPAWEARHGLKADEYQATFDSLTRQGFRLTTVSGYAVGGEARYAAIWEQREGPEWQARHGLTRAQYQQEFDELTRQGFVLRQVSGYRVNVDVLFAGIWEKEEGVTFEARHGLTGSEYQKTFDELVSSGHRLTCVSGYSDTGIARYAAVWRHEQSAPWQARHGLDANGYQHAFDELVSQHFRPVQVSGYGDGFYPA